jgi:hypothetical protein
MRCGKCNRTRCDKLIQFVQTDAVRRQDCACSNVSALSNSHCALLLQHKWHVTCGRELEQDAHNGEDVECGVV